jgi:hypothetical protein
MRAAALCPPCAFHTRVSSDRQIPGQDPRGTLQPLTLVLTKACVEGIGGLGVGSSIWPSTWWNTPRVNVLYVRVSICWQCIPCRELPTRNGEKLKLYELVHVSIHHRGEHHSIHSAAAGTTNGRWGRGTGLDAL